MSLVVYAPGKLGDLVLQWPVARALSRQRAVPIECWIDEKTCAPLKPLLEAQPEVSLVKLVNQSKHYQCGGQPWQGDFPTEAHVEHEIHSLGFRQFPTRQITMETLANVPFHVDTTGFATEPQFKVDPVSWGGLVLHGTFRSSQGTPGFWRFLNDHAEEFKTLFTAVKFVGTTDEVARGVELYPEFGGFADGGNLLGTARLMAGARCVIAAGSSMAALAGALKVPCIRVHDDIGGLPKVIWSNLGENQLNETERDLRELWPEWKKRWVDVEVPA